MYTIEEIAYHHQHSGDVKTHFMGHKLSDVKPPAYDDARSNNRNSPKLPGHKYGLCDEGDSQYCICD